jgi:hypothetical protein
MTFFNPVFLSDDFFKYEWEAFNFLTGVADSNRVSECFDRSRKSLGLVGVKCEERLASDYSLTWLSMNFNACTELNRFTETLSTCT